MATPAFSWRDDKRAWNRAKLDLEYLSKLVVTAGVHGDAKPYEGDGEPITMPQLAAVHEFGRLDESIPERSFIRSGLDGKSTEILDAIEKGIEGVVMQRKEPRDVASLAGVLMEGAIKERIGEGISPALAESTKAARDRKGRNSKGVASLSGSYTPLHDTGQLLQSITHVVGFDDGEGR